MKERTEITDCRGWLFPFVKHQAHLNELLDQDDGYLAVSTRERRTMV